VACGSAAPINMYGRGEPQGLVLLMIKAVMTARPYSADDLKMLARAE